MESLHERNHKPQGYELHVRVVSDAKGLKNAFRVNPLRFVIHSYERVVVPVAVVTTGVHVKLDGQEPTDW